MWHAGLESRAPRKNTMSDEKRIEIQQKILVKNDELANELRREFRARGMTVLNVISSPGSGKTMLLERTLDDLASGMKMAVIVGDLETDNDADRLQGKGAPAVQIQTHGRCHLDAKLVSEAWKSMAAPETRLLIIENVGNLVCPTSYDLGEDLRVVLHAVTEGEDKPLKYPGIFRTADLVIITKMDLAKACEFDEALALKNIRQVAPQAEVLKLSAKSGEGLDAWYGFITGSAAPEAA